MNGTQGDYRRVPDYGADAFLAVIGDRNDCAYKLAMAWFQSEAPPNVRRFAAGDGECYLYDSAQAMGDFELGRFSYFGEHGFLHGWSPMNIGIFCSVASNFHCAAHGEPHEGRAGAFPFAEVLGVPIPEFPETVIEELISSRWWN